MKLGLNGVKFKKLHDIRQYIQRRSMLIKILASYLIIGAILLSSLSTILFKRFSQNSEQDISKFSEQSIEQSYRVISTLWSTTYLFMYNEFANNSILAEAMYSKELTPLKYGEISKRLNQVVINNNIIHSVFIFNRQMDTMFSNIGPATAISSFYDPDIMGCIEKAEGKDKRMLVLYRKMSVRFGVNLDSRNVISVVFTSDNFNSAIIYNLDQDILQKMVAPENADESTQTMIITEDGTILSHPDISMIFKNKAEDKIFAGVLQTDDNLGHYVDSANGVKYMISYKKWDSLGWIFINMGEYNKVFSRISSLRHNVFLWTGIFILLGIFVAALFIRNVFTPFYKLLSRIKPGDTANVPGEQSEYAYLNSIYESLSHDIDDLRKFKNKSRVVMKNELLNRILQGGLAHQDELKNHIKELGLCIKGEEFIVCVLRIDNMGDITLKYSKEDLALYRFLICNIAEELFSEKYTVEAVDSGEDNICIIISTEDDKSIQFAKIKEIVLEIQSAVQKNFQISLTAGVGTSETSLTGIYYSYKNALEATNYRLVMGTRSVISYEAVIIERQEHYAYPFEIEKSLIDALKSADEQKVESFLKKFIDDIGKFTYDEIMLALNQLLIVTVRTVKGLLDASDMEKYGMYADKLTNNTIKGFDTIEEIQDWLMDFYANTICAIKRKREDKYEDIVAKILSHINENYNDPSLSVDLLGRVVNLSPNYIRTLFKDNNGISISSYINSLRLTKAKEFLVQTEYPANKIGEMVGLPSGYFYTVFKKAVGMSPDEYRKLNRG